MAISRIQFLKAYHLSRPAAVQRMREIHDFNLRKARALTLAKQGYIIDKEIDVDQHPDPLVAMSARQTYGFAWYPDMMAAPVPPPTHLPVPPGTIKTSVSLADYPPLTPPRTFGLIQFHSLVQDLLEAGIIIQNEDRRMMLESDAEEATPHTLKMFVSAPPPIFAGAQLHFGVVINGTVYDAEELAVLMPNLDDVRSYIANRAQVQMFNKTGLDE